MIEYRCFPEQRLVQVRCTGHVELGDALAFRRRLAADPGFDPSHDELIDLRDTTDVDVDAVDIQRLVGVETELPGFLAPRRVALVSPGGAVYGVARIYMAMEERSPLDVQLFRTMVEAASWLGLASPPQLDLHNPDSVGSPGDAAGKHSNA